MIVCHCYGVTDREIKASVRCGARTCSDVADTCGAGSGCGGCHELVAEIVSSERRHLAVVSPLAALQALAESALEPGDSGLQPA